MDLDQTALTGAVGSRSTLFVQERSKHFHRRQNQATCVVIGVAVNSEFSRGFYFRETSYVRSFVKIKFSRNGEITMSFTDIGESCPSHDF